jgi:hypothetical protein
VMGATWCTATTAARARKSDATQFRLRFLEVEFLGDGVMDSSHIVSSHRVPVLLAKAEVQVPVLAITTGTSTGSTGSRTVLLL